MYSRVVCGVVVFRLVVRLPRHHDEDEEQEADEDHRHVEMPPATNRRS